MQFTILSLIAIATFVTPVYLMLFKSGSTLRSDWMQGLIDAEAGADTCGNALYNVGVVSYHTNTQMRKNIELAKQYKNKAVICE